MLRAAAAPERFLTRGFARFLSSHPELLRAATKKSRPVKAGAGLGVALPLDLVRFVDALGGRSIAELVATSSLPALPRLLASAEQSDADLLRLVALLASGIPFGETSDGAVFVYFLGEAPAGGMIALLEPGRPAPQLVCRGTAELAIICTLHALDEPFVPPPFGIAEQEAVRTLVDRARALARVLVGTEGQARTKIRILAKKPLDVPLGGGTQEGRSGRKPRDTASPLALGALFESFFREDRDAVLEHLVAHTKSADDVVRDAVKLLYSALDATPRASAAAKTLARRREVTLRALRPTKKSSSTIDTMERTERIVARFDALPPTAETYSALHEREETLLALAALGDRRIAPVLLGRALRGDVAAVEMLAALGDRALIPHLLGLLGGERTRARLYEAAIVRTLVAVRAKEALPRLRQLLEENPMTGWREGLERGVLVRELVLALGELEDRASAGQLLSILESTSQEYRAVLPTAAYALGRLRHVPALSALTRLLVSPKDPITCEAIWATGAIGQAHPASRADAAALLEQLTGLEPGADATRVAALAKLRSGRAAPKAAELRRAIDRALWEPAFRQEETSRRRGWGLRALEDLATVERERGARIDADALFLGHEAVRHLLTRDDHRVRRAAQSAFAAWGIPIPKVRHYFAFALVDVEEHGGIDALHEAVRDPLGVFRHNVATRLAEIGDPRSTRPLAEATARLFAEPPTSTYEYDDAPPNLVAFVRALAKMNTPEGNEVLIEGLRSDNHQVRAVIAESAPDDERFVPELMAMLGDPRSFLRSRAEKSLISVGALPPERLPITTEVTAITTKLVEV